MHIKNNIVKEIAICLSIILIPIIAGTIFKFAFHIPTAATCAVIYAFLSFIFLPFGDISGSTDYNTKRINPGYRPETKKLKSLSSFREIIHLIIAVAALLISFTILTS